MGGGDIDDIDPGVGRQFLITAMDPTGGKPLRESPGLSDVGGTQGREFCVRNPLEVFRKFSRDPPTTEDPPSDATFLFHKLPKVRIRLYTNKFPVLLQDFFRQVSSSISEGPFRLSCMDLPPTVMDLARKDSRSVIGIIKY
jgi:hypothetical protein